MSRLANIPDAPLAAELLRGATAAAEYIGVPRRVIYRMAETGDIPHVRKGQKLFFKKSDLEEAFKLNVDQNTAPTVKMGGGISRRDWFAGCALQGMLSQARWEDSSIAAQWAFEYADAILARELEA